MYSPRSLKYFLSDKYLLCEEAGVPEGKGTAKEKKYLKTLLRISPRFGKRLNPTVPKGSVSLKQEKHERNPNKWEHYKVLIPQNRESKSSKRNTRGTAARVMAHFPSETVEVRTKIKGFLLAYSTVPENITHP